MTLRMHIEDAHRECTLRRYIKDAHRGRTIEEAQTSAQKKCDIAFIATLDIIF